MYVGYGGHVGDCGNYHGWVMGINAANPAMKGALGDGRAGRGRSGRPAVWRPTAPASSRRRATGPAAAAVTHMDSEEVVRITGMGTRADTWYPSRWSTMDGSDADLGSVNPVYVELPGATPSKMIVQLSKDGHLYILDATALGGSRCPRSTS